jgi:hypothetical protein
MDVGMRSDDRTVSYATSDGWDSTAGYVQAISTVYSSHINTAYKSPKPYDVLHSGDWFVERAARDASRATRHFAVVLVAVAILVGVTVEFWGRLPW